MKTILLIEDNPEILANTGEILEMAGYTVLLAENGQVASKPRWPPSPIWWCATS